VTETRIFADDVDPERIDAFVDDPRIAGFTTSPRSMLQAGVTDYAGFARALLARVDEHLVSFDVLADQPAEIRRQAQIIATWAENVYVRVPLSTTTGESLIPLVSDLASAGVKLDVTAVLTIEQIERVADALQGDTPSFVSVSAGRIADTGVDPMPILRHAIEVVAGAPGVGLIWAAPREVLNVVQARELGCDAIALTAELIAKLGLIGKDLRQYSLETVRMFRRDAVAAGFAL
jgi:transaldolase